MVGSAICRCCKHTFAVIVALHYPATKQTWDRALADYDVHEYGPVPHKVLYCLHCGTLDKRGGKNGNWFIRKAYKVYPYYRNEFKGHALHLIRESVDQYNNVKEAIQFEEEKAAREGSAGNGDQESVPAEMRESSRASQYTVLRIQRAERK